MKKNPEKHVCAWGPLPSQITVHVFDSKGKGKDNSDMLWGRWSDTFDTSQGRYDCGSGLSWLPLCLHV